MKKRGIMIAFEGIDGSGKTTCAKSLVKTLETHGVRCVYLHLRYWNWIVKLKELLRKLLRMKRTDEEIGITGATAPSTPKKSAFRLASIVLYRLLYTFVEVVPRKLLGKNIVVDRYVYESFAGLLELGYSERTLVRLSKLFPRPDVVLILDAPAEVVYGRKKSLQAYPVECYERMRRAYLKLAKLLSFEVIDASRSLHEVLSDVNSVVLKRLKASGELHKRR